MRRHFQAEIRRRPDSQADLQCLLKDSYLPYFSGSVEGISDKVLQPQPVDPHAIFE